MVCVLVNGVWVCVHGMCVCLCMVCVHVHGVCPCERCVVCVRVVRSAVHD